MKKTAKLLVLLAALVMVVGLTLTACGKQAITYVLNGGTNPASAPVEYKEGEALDLSTVKPTRTGYTFDGWYFDAQFKTKASITEDTKDPITVYAKWTANVYAITYVLDGGNLTGAPTEYTYAEGVDLSVLNPTKEHYTFAGWYLDAEFTTEAVINETTIEDVTLYAKWTPVDYALVVELDGGTISSIPAAYTYSVGLDLAQYNPSKTHYVFEGWFTDAECTAPITAITAEQFGEVKIYAKWTLYNYTITYDYGTDDEVTHDGAVGSYNYGFVLDIEDFAAPAREGYVFSGWYADAEYTTPATGITAEMGEDLTYYAKWTPIYAIEYELNSGRLTDKPAYGVVGTELDLSALVPTRKGYDFIGWYTDAEFTTAITAIPATQTDAITLYAKFEKTVYTIEYVLPEGVTIPDDAVKTYTYGEGANVLEALPTPVGEKKEFAGWYADADFTIPAASALTVQSSANLTLYAKMTPVSFAITYNYQTNATTATLPEGAPTRYYYGTGVEVLPEVLVDEKGYIIFSGWYADEAFTTPVTSIAADSEVPVTLYAKYDYEALITDGTGIGKWGGTLARKDKEGCNWEIRTDEQNRSYLWIQKGPKDPQLDFGDNIDTVLTYTDETVMSYKITLAKDGENATPSISWRLRYYKQTGVDKASVGNQVNLFTTSTDGRILLNGSIQVGQLTTEPQTFYFVIDFADSKIKAYNENGILIAETGTIMVAKPISWNAEKGTAETESIPLSEGRYLFKKGDPDGDGPLPALTSNTSFLSPYFSENKGVDGFIRMYDAYVITGNAWEKPIVEHNITFNGLEGADPIELPATYIQGLGIKELPQPTKSRAQFVGWYTTPDFQEGTLVTSISEDASGDITLYAKFEGWTGKGEGQGYVTYETFDGALVNPVDYEVYTEGEEFALREATAPSGFAFGGWYTDPSFAPWSYVGTKLPTTMTGDVDLYANWIKVLSTSTITGEENIIHESTKTTSYKFGDTSIQIKEGTTIVGVKDEEKGNYLVYTPASGKDTAIFYNGTISSLDAGARVVTYSVTLAKNGENDLIALRGRTRNKLDDKTIEVNLFYIDIEGNLYLSAGSAVANRLVEGVKITNEFTTLNFVASYDEGVIYLVNEAGAVLAAQPIDNYTVSLLNSQYDGSLATFYDKLTSNNIFSIYGTAPKNAGDSVLIKNFGVASGADVTIADTTKFGKINYAGVEDATLSTSSFAYYTEGFGAKLYNPTKEGYVFAGWYADADFTTPITAIGAQATGDITVYAKWLKVVANEDYTDVSFAYGEEKRDQFYTASGFVYNVLADTTYVKTETDDKGNTYLRADMGQKGKNVVVRYTDDATKLGIAGFTEDAVTYELDLKKVAEIGLPAININLTSSGSVGGTGELRVMTMTNDGSVKLVGGSVVIANVNEDAFSTVRIVVNFAKGTITAYAADGTVLDTVTPAAPEGFASLAEWQRADNGLKHHVFFMNISNVSDPVTSEETGEAVDVPTAILVDNIKVVDGDAYGTDLYAEAE